MSAWERSDRHVLDRRGERVPTCWVARAHANRLEPALATAGVHRIGHWAGTGTGYLGARAVADRIVGVIQDARDVVVLCSFLLSDKRIVDAVLAAAGRRVRVYVLTASEARLEREPREDSEFDIRRLEEHRVLLRQLVGHVLVRSSAHIHAKVVLVDPRGESRRGVLLTSNVTSEALERNPELAVELEHAEIEAVWFLLRWALWEDVEHEVVGAQEGARFTDVKRLDLVESPPVASTVRATTRLRHDLRDTVLQVIESARDELVVASFGWDPDHDVLRRIAERAQAGLAVTVLARVRERVAPTLPALELLARAGARVLGFEWLHAKALVADAQFGVVATANLEPHGLDDGFELGVLLDGARAAALREHLVAWIGAATWGLVVEPTIGSLPPGKVQIPRDGRLVVVDVIERAPYSAGPVDAPSATSLIAAPDRPGSLPLAHEVDLTWTVRAPRLARGARALDGGPPAGVGPQPLREPSGRVVIAVTHHVQMAEAERLAVAHGGAPVVVQEWML